MTDPTGAQEPFQIGQEDRFDRLRQIAWWDQDRLAKATVMVVGTGAIGNEVIKNLALLGIGHLILVDRDTIELSNLTRSILFREADCGKPKAEVAAQVVRQIHPECEITAVVGDILLDVGLAYFHRSDIVLGCLDNREARLWVNRCCWRVGRPWIDAGIQEIHGALQLFGSRSAPCYECGMKELDYRLISARYSCPGVGREPQGGHIATTPTIASLIGAWQSQLAVKALHSMAIPWGASVVFNGLSDQSYRTQLQAREDCLSHEAWEPDWLLGDESKDWNAGDLMKEASKRWGGDWRLMLERRIAIQLTCDSCGTSRALKTPLSSLGAEEGRCPTCDAWLIPTWIDSLDTESELAKFPLRQLGIPMGDWVRLRSDQHVRIVGLATDRNR